LGNDAGIIGAAMLSWVCTKKGILYEEKIV
jgi:hypothetical protein